MSWIRGKLADHVGDHVVLSPEGAVLVTSPGTESSYPRPPHSLNGSPTYMVSKRLVTPADDKQVKYFNPHAIDTVRPLPVPNKQDLLKLYSNTQYVPKPSFTEEIN